MCNTLGTTKGAVTRKSKFGTSNHNKALTLIGVDWIGAEACGQSVPTHLSIFFQPRPSPDTPPLRPLDRDPCLPRTSLLIKSLASTPLGTDMTRPLRPLVSEPATDATNEYVSVVPYFVIS